MHRPDPAHRPAVVAAAVLLATVWCALPWPSSAADADPHDKLRDVEQTLSAERQRETLLKRKRSRIETELAALRKGLVAAATRIQNAEDQSTDLEKRLTSLDRLLDEKTGALVARRKDISATVSAMIRVSRRPGAVLISAPGSVIDVARSGSVMRHVTEGLRRQSRNLQRDLIQLASLRGDIARERKTLDDTLAVLSKERGALDILLARKASLRQRTVTEQTRLNKRLARLSREATDLRSLLKKLDAETARQHRQEQAAAEAAMAATAAKPDSPASGKPAVEQPTESGTTEVAAVIPPPPPEITTRANTTFAHARGRLPLPARGRIVKLYGTPNDNGGHSKGITLSTRPNATVVAPYDGEIVFAGQFRGYGELLIIAHGEGYHTLLAGMARIYGVVGQRLLSGEPVGLMGEGSKGVPRLYVELRRNGAAINPVPWLAASERKVSG